MKVLVAISAPDLPPHAGAGAAQFQFTNLAAALRLICSRLEMCSDGGHFDNNGISASWHVEQSTPAPAETEENAA